MSLKSLFFLNSDIPNDKLGIINIQQQTKHEYLKQKRLAPTIEIRLDVKLSSRVSKTSAKPH